MNCDCQWSRLSVDWKGPTEGRIRGDPEKAIDYGIPVVTEDAFLLAIGIPSDTIGRISGRWARG